MSQHRAISLILSLFLVFNLAAGTVSAAPNKPANPKFTVASITVKKGDKVDLNSKLKSTAKVSYRFAISDSKVASVSAAGVVTGISPGKATVTATVSQTGYSGKASVVIQVGAPTTGDGAAIGATKSVVYKDMALLDADIRKGLQTLFKKDYAKLTDDEKTQLDKLMQIDRQQLLTGLQSIVAKGTPSWSTAMAQEFAVHNLEGNIKDIAALFTNAGSDQVLQHAAFDLLRPFKSDQALKAFGSLLMYSSDASLRYSVAYLISKFEGNSEALSLLINATMKETDESAWTNEAASLISVAGTDPNFINLVVLTYGQFSDTYKTKFARFFGYDDPARAELFKVWIKTLTDNQQSTVDALKNASSSLLNDLKKFPHFRD
ncbi:hypothetical protein D7Z26_01320 [Cohnella endophytica]|uniref:BIG2 domain-containing protein n=1 Tax=Cohnella endophytica TaxID=2419778 RepID=A0A494Y795_9BACL|nr:Ig-like domain-containing protein [Cohnella endophytica]RKP58174.1 hypothetical protein D7Z26_01320 [Cohnella endophytica]